MINKHQNRVRFAPSPSGHMHLGNIRAAVLNYLCAQESQGTFILRIEDTDQQRTFSECYQAIFDDLKWLNIIPDEGPEQGGLYGPYTQSQRNDIYLNYLNILINNGNAYRCFATKEDLEKVRQAQAAQKLPPRYDRKYHSVTSEKESELIAKNVPFIWRLKLPSGLTKIEDKARGTVTYDLKNFSDCPLTRQDGSFTFLFANFVDDVEMKISYVVRGEDHMSNTAIQSAMYDVFNAPKPLFYHLPIICNQDGQKLSKRDFGFSLQDLIADGYLPEAILNYLILLGNSFEEEIFSLQEAAEKKLFEKIKSTGCVQYSSDKLLWVNKKWMQKINHDRFVKLVVPFITQNILNFNKQNIVNFDALAEKIKSESTTLKEAAALFKPFILNPEDITVPHHEIIKSLLACWNIDTGYEGLAEVVKNNATQKGISAKEFWMGIRLLLTGSEKGLSIKDILQFLSKGTLQKRIYN